MSFCCMFCVNYLTKLAFHYSGEIDKFAFLKKCCMKLDIQTKFVSCLLELLRAKEEAIDYQYIL